MYTIIEDMSSVRIFILETDVVCLVLHDCLDWQGHHPSHSVSVDKHNIIKYIQSLPFPNNYIYYIGHAYIYLKGESNPKQLITWEN